MGVARGGSRICRGNRFERVQNRSAAFAAKELVVGVLEKLLKNVRQDAHAAAAALAVAGFRERDAVVALANASVKNAQIFGDGCDGALALGKGRFQILFLCAVLRLDFLTLGCYGLFRLL